MTESQKRTLIIDAFVIVKKEKGYSQATVVKKLQRLGYPIKAPLFNKIIKSKGGSAERVNVLLDGMVDLLGKEFCLMVDEQLAWQERPNCLPVEIILEKDNEQTGLIFHREGRLSLEDKVNFFNTAQHEIIEFGTTLNTFSNYFISRKSSEFYEPIKDILARGVHLKCFLIDPDWNGTRFYFEDRKSDLDKEGTAKIRNSLRKLKTVITDFDAYHFPGKFEVFTYRHFPHNYFGVVDRNHSTTAKMLISNYLYGEKRAYCPVLEFSRQTEPTLFIRYKTSLDLLMKNAKKVDFNTVKD